MIVLVQRPQRMPLLPGASAVLWMTIAVLDRKNVMSIASGMAKT
jgi:hypothetical protein